MTELKLRPRTKANRLFVPAAQKVCEVAQAAGGEGRLVGGIVRDWLLGRPLGDIDMAVTVPIGDFMAQARARNLTIIETGLAHGSVTLRYEGVSVEVTQTRADIAADGRHATIGFTPSFEEDAKRRDFTMNALYLDQAGTLHDPLNGQSDLAAGRIRFIGDASSRMTEDYLRILRFVRFGATLDGFVLDEGDIAALAPHFAGLKALSAERIIYELQRLFAGKNWLYALSILRETGLDVALFQEPLYPPHPLCEMLEGWQVVAASCLTPQAANGFLQLPFARSDKAMITAMLAPFSEAEFTRIQGDSWHEQAHFGGPYFYHRCLVQSRFHVARLSQKRLTEIENFKAPPCPVTGHDLQRAGVPAGPDLGALLQMAERHFVKSFYQRDKASLMAELRPQIEKMTKGSAASR